MKQKSFVRVLLEPLAIAIALATVARMLVSIYTIPSQSMEPVLRAGDHILVTPFRFPFLDDRPSRGDVIVFRSPLDPSEAMVKRIVGIPGDLVESRVVPADCYFVMGDNRADSIDSRQWGFVPRDLVIGRARLILWSSSGSRWQPAQASTRSPRSMSRAGFSFRLFVPVE